MSYRVTHHGDMAEMTALELQLNEERLVQRGTRSALPADSVTYWRLQVFSRLRWRRRFRKSDSDAQSAAQRVLAISQLYSYILQPRGGVLAKSDYYELMLSSGEGNQMKVDWSTRALTVQGNAGTATQRAYRKANADIVRKTINGIGIDSCIANAAAGIRIAYNLSSAHVPAVLLAGYKNCYDLSKGQIGGAAPPSVSKKRALIDKAIAKLLAPGASHEEIYYGAVELNGCGMRYYGDLCLVLRPATFANTTVILDRNSYDLQREPIRSWIASGTKTIDSAAGELAGDRSSVPDMLVCKVLSEGSADQRLLTSGTISQAVLADEDYHEVPRIGSFGAIDVSEIRTTSADAAAEASIGNQLNDGVTPSVAELLWRQRRRDAYKAASQQGLSIRVVVSDGRVRS